ncbi:MAG: hypothetical protein M0R49_13410 [Limnochordia bacterium]|nr:hypothetical protein [Limnochordia bacterium]
MYRQLRYPLLLVVTLLLALTAQVGAADYRDTEALIHSKEVPKIQEAINLLEEKLESNPEDGEALWLIAKAYLYLGDRVVENRLEVLESGKSYADLAVQHLPTSPHPHFWQASLMGRIGQTRGILSSLFMVRPMKDALDQAIQLDETYADAHWVLSQLYQQAPGFPLSIGNKKSSLQSAERAVELDPSNLEYLLQLALALEYNGRKNEAIATLDDLLANPALKEDPELKVEVEEHYAAFTK